MALESFPPLALVASRFLISGVLMFCGALWMGAAIPRGRELWLTALNGVLILGIGNGCLTWAETLIPSGLAALFLTTSPFWMACVATRREWIISRGRCCEEMGMTPMIRAKGLISGCS